MRGVERPDTLPCTVRVPPVETTVWSLIDELIRYRIDSDSDYELVLKDVFGNTMIVEIPSPKRLGSSAFLSEVVHARRWFDDHFRVKRLWQVAKTLVRVVGVGFFDSLCGGQLPPSTCELGAAPNGIELNPVFDLGYYGIVPCPVCTPTFSPVNIGATPTPIHPRRSGWVTVTGHFKVNGKGQPDATMHVTWYYRTGSRTCSGTTDPTGVAHCRTWMRAADRVPRVKGQVRFDIWDNTYPKNLELTPR